MAEIVWTVQSPLAKTRRPGRHGADTHNPAVQIADFDDWMVVQVMARRGRWAETAAAAEKLFGSAPPSSPRAVPCGNGLVLLWSGPGQFYAVARSPADETALKAAIVAAFSGVASVSDQSDGRVAVCLSGAHARDVLAKISSIDTDDSVFPPGSAAVTAIDHTPVNLWRDMTQEAAFVLLLSRSFADSLWQLIFESSLEYGVEVAGTPQLHHPSA